MWKQLFQIINKIERILFNFKPNRCNYKIEIICVLWLISGMPSDMLRVRYLVAHCQEHRDMKTRTFFPS